MGKIKNGQPNGKIGEVTTYTRRGKVYVRRSIKKIESDSDRQKCQRGRFLKAIKAFGCMSKSFAIGFDHVAREGQTGYNAGVGYNMSHAMFRTDDDWNIDWSKVQVSQGSIDNLYGLTLEKDDRGYVFGWSRDCGGMGDLSDEVFVSLYNTELGLSRLVDTHVNRDSMGFVLPASSDLTEYQHLCWVFVRRKDTNVVSSSVQLGEL